MEEENDFPSVVMVGFAVINASGDILRIGQCEESELTQQADTGETVLLNPPAGITDESHYYKNGTYKVYPTRPGEYSVFNYSTEAWTDPRPTDKNGEFDITHYVVEPAYTVSGTSLNIDAFVATRHNGVWGETKNRAAVTVAFPGSPVLVAYNWDANTVTTYANFAALNAVARSFLIGEFRASGVFVPASILVNGDTVAINSLDTPQIKPGAVIGSKLSVANFGNLVTDPTGVDLDAWSANSGDTTMYRWSTNAASTGISTNSALAILTRAGTYAEFINSPLGYTIPSKNNGFPVVAGETYYIKAIVHKNTGNTPVRAYLGLRVGNDVDTDNTSVYPRINFDWTAAQSGWGVLEGLITIPDSVNGANSAYALIHGGVGNNATLDGIRVLFGNMVIRRATSSEILANNAVKTDHIDDLQVSTSKIADRAVGDIRFTSSNSGKTAAALTFTSTAKSKILILMSVYSNTYGVYNLIITKGTTTTTEQLYLGNTANHVTPDTEYTMSSFVTGYEGSMTIRLERVGVGAVKALTIFESKK